MSITTAWKKEHGTKNAEAKVAGPDRCTNLERRMNSLIPAD
jgi:hypothetical protein